MKLGNQSVLLAAILVIFNALLSLIDSCYLVPLLASPFCDRTCTQLAYGLAVRLPDVV